LVSLVKRVLPEVDGSAAVPNPESTNRRGRPTKGAMNSIKIVEADELLVWLVKVN